MPSCLYASVSVVVRAVFVRGVRLVASAHGDLQSLLKNPNLNTIVGGTTSATVGDKAAAQNGGNKVTSPIATTYGTPHYTYSDTRHSVSFNPRVFLSLFSGMLQN